MASGDSPFDTDPMAAAITDDMLVESSAAAATPPPLPSAAIDDDDLLSSVQVPLIRSDGSDYVVEPGSLDEKSVLEHELASIKLANDVLEDRVAKLDNLRQEAASGEYQVDMLRAMMVNLESERDQAWEVADELRRRCAVLEEQLRDGGDAESGIFPGVSASGHAAPEVSSDIRAQIEEVEQSSRKLQAIVRKSTSQIQHYMFELETARGSIARNLEEQHKFGEAVTRLHSGVSTLESYAADEDIAQLPAPVFGMIEELRASTNEMRLLSQRSERFGKSISAMLERLTKVLMS